MDEHHHTLQDLFAQLGLDDTPAGIRRFIRAHGPLGDDVKLSDASFWSPSQAALLREKLKEDADWSNAVDTLNTMLRSTVRELPQAEGSDTGAAHGGEDTASNPR
ncbi:MAG: DUF2789 domain-containing protein [Burkholderiaceae bacterium]